MMVLYSLSLFSSQFIRQYQRYHQAYFFPLSCLDWDASALVTVGDINSHLWLVNSASCSTVLVPPLKDAPLSILVARLGWLRVLVMS
jgi:hypothetical protein